MSTTKVVKPPSINQLNQNPLSKYEHSIIAHLFTTNLNRRMRSNIFRIVFILCTTHSRCKSHPYTHACTHYSCPLLLQRRYRNTTLYKINILTVQCEWISERIESNKRIHVSTKIYATSIDYKQTISLAERNTWDKYIPTGSSHPYRIHGHNTIRSNACGFFFIN